MLRSPQSRRTRGGPGGRRRHALTARETYLGYEKGSSPRVTGQVVVDRPAPRAPARRAAASTWSLAGTWTLKPEFVESMAVDGSLSVRFEARDANLVLGAGQGTSGPVRFRLTLDGQPRAQTTARTWMPMATAWWTPPACTSWCARAARCGRAPWRSAFSIPARAAAFTFG